MSVPEKTNGGLGAPQALASYQLLGKIARGGMGTVYVARRGGVHGFQRMFAVKLMHEHLADNEEFAQMFLDEARIAAQLHHPNVVAIVDIGEADGRHFVVMDYVEGCSLGQLLKLSPEVRPPEAIVAVTRDFLLGLHAAHELRDGEGNSLNLVHRDVSPQNILIGLDGVARITDFGIAKAESRMTSTRPGLRKGKLAFMAPEQLNDQDIDRRADVFAAGAVLWSSLTGEALFAGSNEAATMRNLLQREVVPPSSVGLKPPDFLDAVCLKALDRDPEGRFQTAAEMAAAIRDAAIEHGSFGTAAHLSTWVRDAVGDKIEVRRKVLGGAVSSDSSIRTMPVLVDSTSMGQRSAFPLPPPAGPHPIGRRQPGPTAIVLVSVAVVLAVLFALVGRPGDAASAPAEGPTVGSPAPTPTVTSSTGGSAESNPPQVPSPPAPTSAGVTAFATPDESLGAHATLEEPAVQPVPVRRRSPVVRRPRSPRPAAASEQTAPGAAVAADPPRPGRLTPRVAVDASPADLALPERSGAPQPRSQEVAMERNPYLRGR